MKNESKRKSVFCNLRLLLKGFLMGIAEIIPGVSGSTIALIVGVYQDFISLLHQLSDFVKEILKLLFFRSSIEKCVKTFKEINFRFASLLFLGMLIAIALFSNIVTFLLENYEPYVMAFFFGLVIASITIPWNEIKEKTFKEFSITLITAVVIFLLLSLNPLEFEYAPSAWYFLLGGALGICAMVLPGVSGSFIFLMIGIYEYIIPFVSNVTRFNFDSSELTKLLALIVGMFFGFIFFVRLLKFGLVSHSGKIFAFLTGLMIASLRVLWPFELGSLNDVPYLALTALFAFVLVICLKRFSL